MSLISDHKERTAPLTGQELAIIEDEDGLRGIRTELLKGLPGDKGNPGTVAIGSVTSVKHGSPASVTNSGTDTDAVLDFVLVEGPEGPMPDLASPGPIGGTTPDAGTFNQLNIKATSSAATLGPELVTNGTFTGNADGWTLGQNWAYGTNNVVLTLDAATEGKLSQTISGIESGALYLVTWTQTHSVANNGTIQAALGGLFAGSAVSFPTANAGSLTAVVFATASGDLELSFTPSQASGGTGTITLDNISVKELIAVETAAKIFDAGDINTTDIRVRPISGCTFMGKDAGAGQSSGVDNTGFGNQCMRGLTTGQRNSAFGRAALSFNATGEYNDAFGWASLYFNRGSSNTAFGAQSLYSCNVGSQNTAIGRSALNGCTNGSLNVGVGRLAGHTDITANTLKTASFCTFIGAQSGFGSTTQYDGATAIGYRAKVTSANTVVLGRTTDNTVIGATGDDGSGDKLQITGKARASAGGRFGSATDNFSISASGHVTLNGAATYWDDMLVEMRESLKGTNAKPDWDATNLGLLFPQNDPSEFIMLNLQLPHRWKEGSTIFPHVHIHQAANQNPVFKLDYRWINFGEAVPATWSTYVMDSLATAYTSGTISNILKGAGISGAGKTISSILQMKLYRDDNVYAGDVLAMSFDIHIECDSLGSNAEYTKS